MCEAASCRQQTGEEHGVKAADFQYERPETLAEALALLGRVGDDVQPLAGGQSLMPMMNFRLAQPDVLVDLNRLDELSGIREAGDVIEIGAMTRYATLERSDLIRRHIPLFTKALPHVAHSAIRNRGTIGGSVALADPAAEMPALLLALGATITAVSESGEREIAAEEFFQGLYETALGEGELVKCITVPRAVPGNGFGFYEVARRHGDYAMAGMAIATQATAPITGARTAFFGVSDRSLLAAAVGQALEGKSTDDAKAIDAACEAIADLDFHDDLHGDTATKAQLAKTVFRRAMVDMAS